MSGILSTPDQLRAQIRGLIEVAQTVAEMIRDAGPIGIPSGHLYAALMPLGFSMEAYTQLISILKQTGRVRESGYVLTWINKPEQVNPEVN